jgi:hypothetical protein
MNAVGSPATRKAVAVACGVACAGAAFAAEALKNASFEEPGGDGQLYVSDRAFSWERWGAWFNRETTWAPVREGQCLMAYHHWKIQGEDTSGVYQDIPEIPAGQARTFRVNATRDKGTNAEFIELRLETLSGGQMLASRMYRMNDLKAGKWTELSVTAKSPTKGMRVLVSVMPGRSTNRKGAVKFDAATLREASTQEIAAMDGPANGLRRRR